MKPSGILCLSGLLLQVSCKESRFNVPGEPVSTITINRFDQHFQTEDSCIDSTFLFLYAYSIMDVGEPDGSMYKDFNRIFHNDADIANLYDSCEKTFLDVRAIEKKLTWAFYRLQYYFPEIPVPTVYMHISAYDESIVSAPGMLSASIDKYLGANHPIYNILFQPYQAQRMYPEKIVTDYMIGWIRSELTPEKLIKQDRLIDYMLYEGKIIYLLKIILPEEPMENITALTTNQLKWCSDNEKNMWDGLMRLKHLYSSDRLTIAKYIEEAPNTAFFPEESPGRAITWTGYRIIESYLNKNTKATLQDLMLNSEAQAILAGSSYHP